jgi:hypothetical protein
VLALGLAPLATLPRRPVALALAVTGALAVALSGLGAFASRSDAARDVYDTDDAALSMQAWRWPPLRWMRLEEKRTTVSPAVPLPGEGR